MKRKWIKNSMQTKPFLNQSLGKILSLFFTAKFSLTKQWNHEIIYTWQTFLVKVKCSTESRLSTFLKKYQKWGSRNNCKAQFADPLYAERKEMPFLRKSFYITRVLHNPYQHMTSNLPIFLFANCIFCSEIVWSI